MLGQGCYAQATLLPYIHPTTQKGCSRKYHDAGCTLCTLEANRRRAQRARFSRWASAKHQDRHDEGRVRRHVVLGGRHRCAADIPKRRGQILVGVARGLIHRTTWKVDSPKYAELGVGGPLLVLAPSARSGPRRRFSPLGSPRGRSQEPPRTSPSASPTTTTT